MTYGDGAEAVVEAFEQWIAPAVIGIEPDRFEYIESRLDKLVRNETARAALDVAMRDIVAKGAGVPIARMLEARRSGWRWPI